MEVDVVDSVATVVDVDDVVAVVDVDVVLLTDVVEVMVVGRVFAVVDGTNRAISMAASAMARQSKLSKKRRRHRQVHCEQDRRLNVISRSTPVSAGLSFLYYFVRFDFLVSGS